MLNGQGMRHLAAVILTVTALAAPAGAQTYVEIDGVIAGH